MKKLIIILVLINTVCSGKVNALWTNKTMQCGGLTRSYRVYQSPNYNAAVPASLLIALHGLGDNMTDFSNNGFNYIADTANIICIYPQAVLDPYAGTAWNSGAGSTYYPNSNVNDIGFLNALIDTAIADYSIDVSRVYLCGFSMGGFMTQRMALQSNTKIAAFVSMSGTIGSGITNFNPGRHVPIAHFHGTANTTVPYTGNANGISVDSLINFWAANNSCSAIPSIYSYPDLANDGITIDRFEYSNGDPQSDVWLYKIYGAGHIPLYQPTNDITEIVELWLFLRRHTHTTVSNNDKNDFSENIQVFPNPSNNKITITGLSKNISKNNFLNVYNMHGQLLMQFPVLRETAEIDVSGFAKGLYILKYNSAGNSEIKRIVKE